MLKKLLVALCIVISIILIMTSKKDTQLVYKEIDNSKDFQLIYLLFENNNLNTNNFMNYFKNIEVIKIYPYINPVYANKIKANYSYSFTKENYIYDLQKFTSIYLEKLRSLGLMKDSNKYQIKGVIINKVLVYSNLDIIKDKFQDFNNIKYGFNLSGIYQKI